MIPLDSDKWNELSHAYGKANDVPDLLKTLEKHPTYENYESEPYYSLWSSLCHQGDTYSASIAALPHLISICENQPDDVHQSIPHLAVCIEISRLEGRCADDTSNNDYVLALKKLIPAIEAMRINNPNKDLEYVHRAAIILMQGDFEKAYNVLNED